MSGSTKSKADMMSELELRLAKIAAQLAAVEEEQQEAERRWAESYGEAEESKAEESEDVEMLAEALADTCLSEQDQSSEDGDVEMDDAVSS